MFQKNLLRVLDLDATSKLLADCKAISHHVILQILAQCNDPISGATRNSTEMPILAVSVSYIATTVITFERVADLKNDIEVQMVRSDML